jgi:membrane fusion protein
MTERRLFRAEALEAKKYEWLGSIVMTRPISFRAVVVVAVSMTLCIVLFGLLGTYTKRSTVNGQLIPSAGVVKVHVPQTGIVLEKHIEEGENVPKGKVLYVLSSERQTSHGNTQERISAQVESRETLLNDELIRTRLLQQEERNALSRKIAGLADELVALEGQLAIQESRIKLATETKDRYDELSRKDYISKDQFLQKHEEFLEQKSRQRSYERERLALRREYVMQKDELTSLEFKQKNQINQIERSIASAGQELTESEAKRKLVIVAASSGIATAATAEIGQVVDSSKPLVTIIPSGATLIAHLYAPSRAIGFIKEGDKVLLRYQAYPYQKFGHSSGTILGISKTSLSADTIPQGIFMSPSAQNSTEPYYRITVSLKSQKISAYGKDQPLQAGMLLEADILQDKRKIFEWALEPLYSLTGKVL